MGDAKVVSGRTRGEHGRGPSLDLLTDQGFGTFVCLKSEQLCILLWPEVKQVINGEVVKQKHYWAKFFNHVWNAPSEKHAEAMRNHRAYRNGKVRDLKAAKEETKAQKAKHLAKTLEADPELAEAFLALTKGKDADPQTSPKKTTPKSSKKSESKEGEDSE